MTELPDPVPKDDEYLIEVRAAATNFFDVLQIAGKYQNQPRMYIKLSRDHFLLNFANQRPQLSHGSPVPSSLVLSSLHPRALRIPNSPRALEFLVLRREHMLPSVLPRR